MVNNNDYLYIIMCGGEYEEFSTPKQLIKINDEPIVARTIRLLRENGVDNIAISTNNPAFDQFGVKILHHYNDYYVRGYNNVDGSWVNGFYQMSTPVCYLFGDVIYSRYAIRQIVETQTNRIEFFASAPPFHKEFRKEYAEPFAFKVADTRYFNECIDLVKEYENRGFFERHPIAWELWQVIKRTPLNIIDYTNYKVINDYTCDIDNLEDAENFKDIDLE